MNTRHELIAQLYSVAAETLPDAYGQWAVGQLARCHDIAGLEWTLSAESSVYRSGLIARLESGAGSDEPVIYQPVFDVVVDGARHVFRLPQAVNDGAMGRGFRTGLFHAATAWSLCRRYSIAGRMDGSDADMELGYAIVHATGEVKVCDSRFAQLLADAGWTGLGAPLPIQIPWNARVAKRGFCWSGLHFQVTRDRRVYRLAVRPDRRLTASVTDREWSVVCELAKGKTYPQIGEALHIAPTTASSHTYKLMEKLGFRKKSELVQWYHTQAVRLA
jgi:DNA-binding CsgD family transcriptional regulator